MNEKNFFSLDPPELTRPVVREVPMAARVSAPVPLALAGYSPERMQYEKHFQCGTSYAWLVRR